jgi:hypothetical protein
MKIHFPCKAYTFYCKRHIRAGKCKEDESLNYNEMKNYLLTVFAKNHYVHLHERKEQKTIKVQSYHDGEIYITFPGYKAIVENGSVKNYDYRVDINKGHIRTSLSHVNIIVDLYAKVKESNGLLYDDIKTLLYNISVNKEMNPLTGTKYLKNYMTKNIETRKDYLDDIAKMHMKIKDRRGNPKYYHRQGNSWDYSIDDIVHSIRWIVLQEDINYPIANGKQGRKMPFKRYYEAIYTAVNHTRSLEEVIRRTLQKGFPPSDWENFDYSLIDDIH